MESSDKKRWMSGKCLLLWMAREFIVQQIYFQACAVTAQLLAKHKHSDLRNPAKEILNSSRKTTSRTTGAHRARVDVVRDKNYCVGNPRLPFSLKTECQQSVYTPLHTSFPGWEIKLKHGFHQKRMDVLQYPFLLQRPATASHSLPVTFKFSVSEAFSWLTATPQPLLCHPPDSSVLKMRTSKHQKESSAA